MLQKILVLFLDLSGGEKCKRIASGVLKFLGVLILLYFFVISLDLLSSSFRLLGGESILVLNYLHNLHISDFISRRSSGWSHVPRERTALQPGGRTNDRGIGYSSGSKLLH